jgi:hypothetical protein
MIMSEEERIERLEHVLGNLIAWLDTTLGQNNVVKLLEALHEDKHTATTGDDSNG